MVAEDKIDLEAVPTEGYKVPDGEAKTVDEYHQLDQNDASLAKWKKSLGLATGNDLSDPSDPRNFILLSLALEVEGRPDVVRELQEPGALEALKKKPFLLKQGAAFRMKIKFRVQHRILHAVQYVYRVRSRGVLSGLLSSKYDEMIGSYSPNTSDRPEYERKFEPEVAPKGFAANGTYDVLSRFVDDDQIVNYDFEWCFEIKKNWDD